MNKELNILIKKAQGERTQNAFALNCGINSASITRILNGENTPKPDILKKIAAHAHNNVSYTDLMIAAGFIDLKEMEEHYFTIPEEVNNIPIAFTDGLDDLTQEDIDLIKDYIALIKERRNKKNSEEE